MRQVRERRLSREAAYNNAGGAQSPAYMDPELADFLEEADRIAEEDQKSLQDAMPPAPPSSSEDAEVEDATASAENDDPNSSHHRPSTDDDSNIVGSSPVESIDLGVDDAQDSKDETPSNKVKTPQSVPWRKTAKSRLDDKAEAREDPAGESAEATDLNGAS